MLGKRALTSLVVGGSLVFASVAIGAPAHAQRVSFCGMARLVQRSCIVVRGSLASRMDFDITGARPRPRRDAMIAGSGRVRGSSPCIRADRRLVDVTWRRVTACPTTR